MLEKLKAPRDLSRTPVFQSAFAVHTPGEKNELFQSALGLPGLRVQAGALELESSAFERGVSRYDLDLMVFESERGLLGSLEYDTELFAAEDIETFVAAFLKLLADASSNPGKKVGEYSLLSESERRFVLEKSRGPRLELSAERSLAELIREQSQLEPERIAVWSGDVCLGYGALQKRAQEIAGSLGESGVQPGQVVGVLLERSLELPAAFTWGLVGRGGLSASGPFFSQGSFRIYAG